MPVFISVFRNKSQWDSVVAVRLLFYDPGPCYVSTKANVLRLTRAKPPHAEETVKYSLNPRKHCK